MKKAIKYTTQQFPACIQYTWHHKKKKTEYEMRIYKREVIQSFLETLLPYLKTKREQAILMLIFCRTKHYKANYNTDIELMTKINQLNQ